MRVSQNACITMGAILGLALLELATASDAFAIIGRPLTPVSVAGVARRTTRRAVVYGGAAVAASETAAANEAAAQSAAAASQSAAASAAAAESAAAAAQSAASAAPAALASLPDGCVAAGSVFKCGTATYKPYVQGGTVVYVPVTGSQ